MIKPRAIRTITAFGASLFLVVVSLSAQTLARPGWVGSGLTAQTWFKHAILYEIDTRTFASSKPDSKIGDLKGITQRLDYIHSLGVDAILLKPIDSSSGCATTVVTGGRMTKLHCVSSGTSPSAAIPPIDPALGTLDDFDDLTLQASRFKIRILLYLPTPDTALARFWLTRGVAGFYIPGNAAENNAAIEAIRKLLSSYVGQRILMTDAGLFASTPASKASSNELILDRVIVKSTQNPVAELRANLDRAQTMHTGTPVFAVAMATPDPRLARILATATLLNRSSALIVAGEELGAGKLAPMPWGQPAAIPEEEAPEPAKPTAPIRSAPDKYTPYVPYVRAAAPKKAAPADPATAVGQEANPNSLLNFYRELGRLHHGAIALRDGEEITFNHDDRNALIWIRKPASPNQFNPPVLIACNLSDKPVVISLKADMARLQLHGNFLRPILRSDDLMGGTSIDPITLPPYGVYVGDLRF